MNGLPAPARAVRRSAVVIAVAATMGLGLSACSSSSNTSSSASPSSSATAGAVTVQLQPQNNSGVSGTATLTPQGDETLVVLDLQGEPDGAYEPAHIHKNHCSNIDPTPQYFLTDSGSSTSGGQLWVQNGKATALVHVPLSQLQSSPHAINVHMSPTDLPHYMACGDIPSAGGSSESSTSTETSSSSASPSSSEHSGSPTSTETSSSSPSESGSPTATP